VDVLVYLAVAMTVISGADYFFGLRRRIEEEREKRTHERELRTDAKTKPAQDAARSAQRAH
jgi:Tfp pilus assembly protein PilO